MNVHIYLVPVVPDVRLLLIPHLCWLSLDSNSGARGVGEEGELIDAVNDILIRVVTNDQIVSVIDKDIKIFLPQVERVPLVEFSVCAKTTS